MNEIYVKVLGTVSPYCKDNHNCPGFLFYSENEKIMLDCGNGSVGQLSLPTDLLNLNVFISHMHKDHFGDLSSLIGATMIFRKNLIFSGKIKIHIPEYYENKAIDFEYIRNCTKNLHGVELIEYDDSLVKYLGNSIISFMKTSHSTCTYSTKITSGDIKAVYSADVGYRDIDNFIKFIYKADLLICDSTFLRNEKTKNKNHLHAYQAAEIAKEAKVKKLLLTHFWPETNRLDYINEAKEIFKNVETAEEGNILKLSR